MFGEDIKNMLEARREIVSARKWNTLGYSEINKKMKKQIRSEKNQQDEMIENVIKQTRACSVLEGR